MSALVRYDEESGEYTSVEVPRDPAELGFPPMLPVELAMRIDTPRNVCAAYGIDRAEFEMLCSHPVFQKAFMDAQTELLRDGMSFRLKARMQAEKLLEKSWTIIHDEHTAPPVAADLIKSTVKWAGYEPKNTEAAALGSAFQININLGGV
jgi:hypothetical protein